MPDKEAITNEELVAKIQAGETGLYEVLWKKVSSSIWFIAKKYWRRESSMFEPSDLMQQSYLGFVKAVQRYDVKAEYSFHKAMVFYVSDACRTLVYPRRHKPDPIHNAESLDGKMLDEENQSASFVDMFVDENAEQQITDVEESADRSAAMSIIRECLGELPERTRRIIIGHYCYDVPFVAFDKEKEGACREWSQTEGTRGLEKIRNMLREREITCRVEAETKYYRQKSVTAFLSSGSSVVEDLVELRERIGTEAAREIDEKLKVRRDITKLVAALKKISKSDQAVIIRHFLENESLQAISRETNYGIDWASGRVKKTIRRMTAAIESLESGKDIRTLLSCIPKEAPEICKKLIEERKAG